MKQLALSIVAVVGSMITAVAQERQIQVAGIVRSATTGEALRSAVVTLRAREVKQGISRTTTGADGSFGFSGLQPGQYQLTASKSGFQMLDAGALVTIRPDSTETTRLAPVLWPGGAIVGRVIDWDGEPVANAGVHAYGVSGETKGATLSPLAKAETDALGEYRVFNLPAGKYLVQVSPPPTGGASGRFYEDAPVVYYPSAPSSGQAVPVELNWGGEVTGANVRLLRGPGYTISGVVWDAPYEGPCTRCVVLLLQQDNPYSITLPQTARVSARGAFAFRGLSSGDYVLIVQQGGTRGALTQSHVALQGRNINDARLIIGVEQSVTGQVMLDNPPEGIDVTAWNPRLLAVGLPKWWPSAEGEITADNRFTFDDVSPARYRLEMTKLPGGAYLKALRSGGRPLASPEILVPSDNPVSGLDAVVAFDGATVQGKVPSPENSARIFLVPVDQSGFQVSKNTESAADGSFTITSIPPGDYTVDIVPAGASPQGTPGRNAIRIRLEPNQTVNVAK